MDLTTYMYERESFHCYSVSSVSSIWKGWEKLYPKEKWDWMSIANNTDTLEKYNDSLRVIDWQLEIVR